MSTFVQVELSLAYECEVSQKSLLKYIHFNRHHNTMLIEHNAKMVKENRRLINANIMKQSKAAALPAQCKHYNVLDSPARHFQTVDRKLCNGLNCCDKVGRRHVNSDWKGTGWYRVFGSAGTKLVDSPVQAYSSCGTDYTGWLDGGHPTPDEGEVTRTVYFNTGSDTKYSPKNVKVINCNNEFFVYYLLDINGCHYAYCTE